MTEPFCWKVSLASPIERVFSALATDEGRAAFWAERTVDRGDEIDFYFSDGQTSRAEILGQTAPKRFSIRYFGSVTIFDLRADGVGTDLTVSVSETPEGDWLDSYAGWVSVLMNLKSVLDFGADLRNHHQDRTWASGYVDN